VPPPNRPGIFPQSAMGTYVENLRFSFCHIDCDYYQGVYQSIAFFHPRMVHGGIILFDDYDWAQCPGVARAIKAANLPITVVEHDYIKQAYYIKTA
jgi:hypothetical protein